MNPAFLGLMGICLFLILLFIGMPIGFAMAVVGFLGFSILASIQAAGSILSSCLYDVLVSYSYSVIVLFIFMGEVAFYSKISERLFGTAYKWLGQYPGGLPMATIGTCGLFAAICGSSPTTSATIGAVALPELRKHNYSYLLSTGTIAAGGTLGPLIPPSVVLLVYGLLTEQSIAKLFAAGAIPGVLLMLMYMGVIFIYAKINPTMAPAGPRTSFKEKVKSLPGILEALMLFVFVIGGLFAGWFSPTEAGGIGAGGIIIIALLRRKLTMENFLKSLFATTKTAAMLLIILAGAMVMGRFLAISEITIDLANWVATLPTSKNVILFFVILVYGILGCITEIFSVMIITLPIIFPIIKSKGFDPIWFGVLMTMLVELGGITPPVGINIFVVKGLAPDVPTGTIYKGVLMFVMAMVLCIITMVIFPKLALFLPNQM